MSVLYTCSEKKSTISLSEMKKQKCKVALNGNTQVTYKSLKIVLIYSTWNVLSYFSALLWGSSGNHTLPTTLCKCSTCVLYVNKDEVMFFFSDQWWLSALNCTYINTLPNITSILTITGIKKRWMRKNRVHCSTLFPLITRIMKYRHVYCVE